MLVTAAGLLAAQPGGWTGAPSGAAVPNAWLLLSDAAFAGLLPGYAFAQSVTQTLSLTAADSITDTPSLELNGATGIAVFESGGSTYAAVASFADDGVQILNVTDPSDITAAGNITDTDALVLLGARDIATFTSGGSTYAAVAAFTDDGVQILNVTDPSDITAAGNITDDGTNTDELELNGARNIAIFESGGSTYAAVAASTDDGVQILNITDPSDITAAGSISDNGTNTDELELNGASGIATFTSGDSTYAAVAAFSDDGVQILNITDPSDITAAGSISDPGTNTDELELNSASGIAIFTSGGSTYAAVTGQSDDGVQILNITDPSDITAAGSITDAGTLVLANARGIATFTLGGSTYAAVAAYFGDGVQILNVTDPSDITAAGSITDDGTNTDELELNGAENIAMFTSGGSIYAAVTASFDSGVQILSLTNTPPTVTAGPDLPVTKGLSVHLTGASAADADSGDVLSYFWSQDPPGTVTFDDATLPNPTVAAPLGTAATSVVLTLSVDDGTNDAVTDTMTLTIQDPPPSFVSSILNDTSGALAITFSEDIDVTPATNVVPAKMHVRESGNYTGGGITLSAGELATTADGATISFALNASRLAAVAALAVPELTIEPGAVRDTSGTLIDGTFDVSTAVFVDDTSISAQEDAPRGLAFSSDGTKMFVVGYQNKEVHKYALSTAFDASTRSFVDSFAGLINDEQLPQDVTFSNDGTRMFVLGSEHDEIHEYTLSTAFDSRNAVLASSTSISEESNPLGMAFSSDGTKMFVIGNAGMDVNEYALSTAFNTTTAVFVDDTSISGQENVPTGMAFSSDGAKMFVIGNQNDAVNEYALTTTFDASTRTFVHAANVSPEEPGPQDVAFSSDGSKMFVIGTSSDDVNEYALSSVYPITVVASAPPPDAFVTTWETTGANQAITIPATGTYSIDWGDGTVNATASGTQTHNYTSAGNHTVAITGGLESVNINGLPSQAEKDKLRSIDQWGNITWTTMASAFQGASNMAYDAADAPNLSGVTSMTSMFYNAHSFNGSLSGWDVSSVTDMQNMFRNAASFNQPLNDWNVSSVTAMNYMFYDADSFNGDLSGWDVSSVTSMISLFFGADSFNGSLSGWDVSSVTSMEGMFRNADSFNGNLSGWDVSQVTSMNNMFRGASSFNQTLNDWNVSSVTNMEGMFRNAASFDQPLNDWNVSSVFNMFEMFQDATSFNQPISDWDIPQVSDMEDMFRGAAAFNQDISTWDVSSVRFMGGMFTDATNFDQNLGEWYVVLNSTEIDAAGAPGIVGTISAQNSILRGQATYGIGAGGDSGSFNITGGSNLNMNITSPAKSLYTVNITSAGSFGTNNHRVYNVTVTGFDTNSSPTVNAGPDQTVDEGDTVTLSGTASDSDNDPLTYMWTHDSILPITLADDTALSTTFTAPAVTQDTTVIFTLAVSDDTDSATDTVSVTITDTTPSNTQPTVNAGPDQTVDEGDTVTLSGTASDSDNDPLTYMWTHDSALSISLADDTALSTTFTAPAVTQDTTVTFTLGVSDDTDSVTDMVSVTITDTTPGSIPPAVDAGPGLTAADSITDTGALKLFNARGIATFESGGGTYAAVTGYLDYGVQILDVTNPYGITAAGSISDDAALELAGAWDVATFTSGGGTYAAVTAYFGDGVQILDVTDPSDITATDSIGDTETRELSGAFGIATFTSGSRTYAAVTALWDDDGVQILDVTNPSAVTAAGSIGDTRTLELSGASDVATFTSGGRTYAAVAAYWDDGVQILDVTNPSSVTAAGSIGDTAALELDGAHDIATFTSGGRAYAAVAAYWDDGVQILDVTDPSAITAAGSITDDAALELDGAEGITVFESGGRTYAAVASVVDDGVQMLDITDPSDITAVGSITDDAALELLGASGIATFTSGGDTYAAVTAHFDSGVQILRLTGGGAILTVSSQFVGEPDNAQGFAESGTVIPRLAIRDLSVQVAPDSPPTVTSIARSDPAGAATSERTLVFAVTFSEDVTGVDLSDFALSPDSTGGGSAPGQFTQTSEPALRIADRSTVQDAITVDRSGTATSVSVAVDISHTYRGDLVIDLIAPDGTSQTLHSRTGGSANDIDRTYAPDFDGTGIAGNWTLRVSDRAGGDVGTLNGWTLTIGHGTAGSPVTGLTGSGDAYLVTVSAAQDGTYNLDLVSSGHGITDSAGNPLTDTVPTTGTDHTYTVGTAPADTTAPTLASIERYSPADQNTDSQTLVYKVTFSEDVTGVDTGDFVLSQGSTGTGSTASLTGSGSVYYATVSAAQDGTYNLDLVSSGHGITDSAGNPLSSPAPTGADHTYTVSATPADATAPTVTSIARSDPAGAATSERTLVFAVAFSEDVTGVDLSDFALSPDSTGGSSSSGQFTQTSEPATRIADRSTIQDAITVDRSGTATSVSVAVDISHTYRGDLVIDLIAPDGTSQTLHSRTGGSADDIDRTYAPGFDGTGIAGNWTLRVSDRAGGDVGTLNGWTLTIGHGTAGSPVTGLTGSGDAYLVTVSAAQDGTYNLDLVSSGHGIADTASNPLTNTAPTGTDHTYTVSTTVTDSTAPTLASIERYSPADQNTDSQTLVYKVTFSEDVTGVDTGDFVLSQGSTGTGSTASLTGSGSVYYATVSAAQDGTYNLDLVSSGHGITDSAGNPLSSPAPTGADHTYTVSATPADATAPTVTSIARSDPAGAATSERTLVFAVAFSEDVTGVDLSDFALSPDSTGGSSSSGQFTQTSEPATRIADRSTIQDAITVDRSGTATSVSVAVDISHTYRGDLVIDLIAPDGTSQTLHSRTGGSADDIDRTYAPGFDGTGIAGDWTLRVSDRAGGDVGTLNGWTLTIGHGTAGSPVTGLAGSGDAYLVTVSAAQDGTYNLDLVSSGHGITDTAGNPLSSPTPTGADHTYTVGAIPADTTAPAVTSIVRSNPAEATTSGRTLVFAVTFSEDVTGVDLSDFALSSGGTGTGSVTNLAGSGSQYLVTVSAAQDGTYNLDLVPSGHGITDSASNPLSSPAPTGADHTYTVHTPPIQSDTINTPPSISAGPDQTVQGGQVVSLTGTATDVDGDPLTYSWSHDSALAIEFANSTAPSTTFTAPQVSSNTTFILTLTVDDGTQAASDSMGITIVGTPGSPRDIGEITLTSTGPGVIEASWEAPTETPADYRIAWAKVGEPYLTWTNLSGNAFPASPSQTVTDLEEGEQYKVKVRARYSSGGPGDWSGEFNVTVAGTG